MLNYFAEVEMFENLNIKNKDTAASEIIVMLLAAFLLGYLLHWLICRGRGHQTTVASKSTRSVVGSKSSSNSDDLKVIEGIGPKIEELLNKDGIRSFADLADAPTSTVKRILDKAGPRFQMHDPSSWAKQARLAADGKMDELEKLKEKLTAGR